MKCTFYRCLIKNLPTAMILTSSLFMLDSHSFFDSTCDQLPGAAHKSTARVTCELFNNIDLIK